MMRPVCNLATNTVESIGSLEQVYMDIAVEPSEVHKNVSPSSTKDLCHRFAYVAFSAVFDIQ